MARNIPTCSNSSSESVANGLFSTSPSPCSVRPLVGALLLAMVEATLVLAASQVAALLKVGAAGILVLSTLVIILGGFHERRPRKAQR